MLKIGKQTPEEGTRFAHVSGAAFWVRPLTSSKLEELHKECTKVKMELHQQSRQMAPVKTTDDNRFNDLLIDYILAKWEGVGDENGNELPVSLENKKLIMDQLILREFIWAAAQALDTTEAERKN